MPTSFQIRSYITYWLDAVEEHSLHSPFFYDFFTRVIKDKKYEVPNGSKIEEYRNQLLTNTNTISITDYGAGSITNNNPTRTISSIARHSTSPKKYSELYARIIGYFKHKHVLELGTSLGINTLYLSTHPTTSVTTFEGDPALISIAEQAARNIGLLNIQYVAGNIDQTLERYLMQSPRIDFALLDANHRYEPTVRYTEMMINRTHPGSLLILDDIHLTQEMEQAWNQLRKHKLVHASADLYRCGILFFDPSLNKQHVVLQY